MWRSYSARNPRHRFPSQVGGGAPPPGVRSAREPDSDIRAALRLRPADRHRGDREPARGGAEPGRGARSRGRRRGSPSRWFPASCCRCSRRRRFAFGAPVAVWVVAAGLSFIDGNLVTSIGALFAAGMAAGFLLGNVEDATQSRIGLAVTLGAAVIIAYNDPTQNTAEFLVTPGLFGIAWLAGFALRERSTLAASAEERATDAEREREENARRAVFEERVRIARELHDVVAHHVSMMGVQAGAARARDRPRSGQGEGSADRDRDVEQPGRHGAAPPARVPAPGRRRGRPGAAAGRRAARPAGRRA